jgi:hypothetical protein
MGKKNKKSLMQDVTALASESPSKKQKSTIYATNTATGPSGRTVTHTAIPNAITSVDPSLLPNSQSSDTDLSDAWSRIEPLAHWVEELLPDDPSVNDDESEEIKVRSIPIFE